MSNVRALNKEKYNMSENRFRELYYFCLQYPEWKKMLADKRESSDSYINKEELSKNCCLIEETALESEESIYPFILKAVTSENITFNYLKMVHDIPCGKKMYYDRRRKFYHLLSQKK